MATLWERTPHSVNPYVLLLCLFMALAVSHLDFEGRNFVLIAPVPGHYN